MNPRPKKEPKAELVQTSIRIPKDKHKQLRMVAVQNDKTLLDLIYEGIDHVLTKYGGKGK